MHKKDEVSYTSLSRSFQREKKIRKLAEQQLEVFSREVFLNKTLLEEQTKQVQAKQEAMQFLSGLMSETWKLNRLDLIISNYIKRCSLFLDCPPCVYIVIKENKLIEKEIYNSLLKEAREKTVDTHYISHLNWQQLREIANAQNSTFIANAAECSLTGSTIDPEITILVLPLTGMSSSNKDHYFIFGFTAIDEVNLLQLEPIETSRQLLNLSLDRLSFSNSLASKVSELEQVNESLVSTQTQLIESEKLASLGLLSAGIAHEINNPLSYVLSNFEYLISNTEKLKTLFSKLKLIPENQFSKKTLDQLFNQADVDFLLNDSMEVIEANLNGVTRVKDIVADLKSFSRMDNHELTTIDVNEVINSSYTMVMNQLKYDFVVEFDLQAQEQIWGTTGQLQQVFINLFTNAKDAMEEGGKLVIRSYNDSNRVWVSVKDNGCGMNEEQRQNLFTPFYTTKTVGKGTGLGLSVSYSILKQHHAKIEVNSVEGKGTEFLLGFLISRDKGL